MEPKERRKEKEEEEAGRHGHRHDPYANTAAATNRSQMTAAVTRAVMTKVGLDVHGTRSRRT